MGTVVYALQQWQDGVGWRTLVGNADRQRTQVAGELIAKEYACLERVCPPWQVVAIFENGTMRVVCPVSPTPAPA